MLLARSFEPGDIDAALAYCVKRRLLDDVGLAVRIAEKTTGKRALSLELLVEKLQRKGASQAALDAVKNHFTEDPQGLLMRFDPARQGDKARAARFLASRGFEENEVESALERYFEPSAESSPNESHPI
jgi:SOS response regulatory protein OraA/RecX